MVDVSKRNSCALEILRVDLSNGVITHEPIDDAALRKYIGGYALAAKYLYEEVPADVPWHAPENRLMFFGGVLSGTSIPGSGGITICAKGALTDGGAATQAQGVFGAYLKRCGLLGIIVEGASEEWQYLVVDKDGKARLSDAEHLRGSDTWETVDALTIHLDKRGKDISVLSIGPAGENLVKWSGIVIDKGHAAMHNGIGAVMGSKKLKAVVVERGTGSVPVYDREALKELSKGMIETVKSEKAGVHYFGTLNGVHRNYEVGMLPIRNYTTNIWDIEEEQFEKFSASYISEHFEPKRLRPCWACPNRHCQVMTITEGPYKGMIVEEPEYEQMSGFGPNLLINDIGSVMMLSNLVDRLGLDVNEAGWTCSCLMELFERGIVTPEELDGLDLTWGNVESVRNLLFKIATREGVGDLVADGVKETVKKIGRGAEDIGIYTLKGNTPRGHDHRGRWTEMFDTCISESGALESDLLKRTDLTQFGLPPKLDLFDPDFVAKVEARSKGSMQLEDSTVTCRFHTRTDVRLLSAAISAVTGWDFDFDEGMQVGLRAINTMRAYNIRSGITGDLDRPSPRYGSVPTDGPAKGKDISPHFAKMVKMYYKLMGWDDEGRPLPDTLKNLGIEEIAVDLWGEP